MRHLISIIIGISIGLSSFAQSNAVTIRIGSDEGIQGSEVLIPVTTEDFSDILSLQGSIAFNESLVQFIGTENYGLTGMTAASFGTSHTSSGYVTFSWYDASLVGESLADGTTLFALRFEVLGNTAQTTPIQLSNDITPVEVVNNLYNSVTVYDQTGQVNILENPNPGTELNIGFSNHSVPEGEEILVPMTVTNFDMITGMQGSISWDPSVLSYVSTETYNLSDMGSGNFGTSQTATGTLTFSWNDTDLGGESLADGQSVFSIRFQAIGSAEEQSNLGLGNHPTGLEFTDASLSSIDYTTIPGTVTIEDAAPSADISILADSVEGGIGAIVQLPVRVRDFNDIISLQGSLSFDPSIAAFDTIIQYGLPSLAYANFGTNNASSGSLSFSWNDPTLAGVTLPEDSAIFVLQFTLVGNIGDISPLDFIETPTPLECVKSDFTVLSTNTDPGQLEIIDVYELEITNVSSDEFCAGESFTIDYFAEGNFLAGNTFQCEMSDNTGDFSSPEIIGNISSTSSGNITATIPSDLPSGNYEIRLLADMPVYTSDVWTSPLTIHALPNADAGMNEDICLGESVTLTATGGIIYAWDSGDNTDVITVNPTLDTEYIVTVEDAFGCQNTDTVEVIVHDLPTANAGLDQNICLGESVTLSATGGVDYEWSNGDMTANSDVSPSSDTEYFVTVTDANACSNTDAVIVNVFEVIADAGTDEDICHGESVTLTATGGTDYAWSSGDNTASTTVSPTADTEYYVTVTGVNLCQDIDTVLVNVHELPDADAGMDEEICLGESVTLTATGGTIYSWDTGDNTDAITVNPTLDTEYIVTVEDAFGCQNTDTVEVIVHDLPTANAGLDQDICLGESVTLSATGGVDYEWSNGDMTANSDVAPSSDTEYFVTVTDANACSNTDAVIVNVFEVIADAGTDEDICHGESVTLTATGGTDYVWSSGDNTASTTVSPTADTEYYVTVTGVNLCQDIDTVLVNVHELPDADAGMDEEICLGESVTLTATGGTIYSWDTGDNTDAITVNPTLDTEYIVTVEDAFGCQNTDTVEVIVHDLPTANAGLDQDICLGESVTLSATGGVDYEWSNGDMTANSDVAPSSDTEYFVTVIDANACSNTDAVIVNVFEVIADAGTDEDICHGESVTLTATGGTDYAWSSGDNTASTTVSPTADTEYYVTVTGVNLCQDIDTVLVNVHELPDADAGMDEEICLGESVTLTATGGTIYSWDTGDNTDAITVNPTLDTEYIVTVEDAFGCQNTDTVEVIVHDLPTANAGLDQNICLGESVTLSATGGVDYEWSNGDMTANSDVAPSSDTEYFVTVTDANACSNTDAVIVNVFEVIADAGTDEDICHGESVTLTATGGTDYAWSSGDNTASTTVSPTADTEYYVTVTGVNLCQDIDTVLVNVHELPDADAGMDEEICLGESVTLMATGGTIYAWDTGDNTDAITVNPTLDTEYIVTVEDAFGCQNTDTVEVIVHDLPTANAGLDQDICLGESVTLSATGGVDYEWSNGDLTANSDVAPSLDTEYFVTVTDANACSNTDAVIVNVFEVIADAGTDEDICNGESVTLTATGGTDYAWSSGDNTASTTVSPTTDTEYYVTVTGVNLCQDIDTVLVNVLNPPLAPELPIGITERCASVSTDTFTIANQSEPVDFIWQTNITDFGNMTSSDTSAIITWNTDFTGELLLFVTASNMCGSENSDSLHIHSYPSPIVDLGNDTTICFGDSIALEAPSGFNYLWSTGSTDISIWANDADTYWLEASNTYCSDIDTIIISLSNPEFYFSEDTVLTELPYTIESMSGFAEYLWSTSETSESITVNEFGWYSVILTDEFGCSVTDSIHIDDATGTFQNISEQFKIFPNPAYDKVNIKSNNIIRKLVIIDAQGKTKTMLEPNRTSQIVGLENFAPGLYTIILSTDKNRIFKKLMIQ